MIERTTNRSEPGRLSLKAEPTGCFVQGLRDHDGVAHHIRPRSIPFQYISGRA